jgi:hypothetical protein
MRDLINPKTDLPIALLVAIENGGEVGDMGDNLAIVKAADGGEYK